jgi:hypothetical protein
MLEQLRAEGVTDEDLRTWYGYSGKHRTRIAELHNGCRAAIYLTRKDQGDSEEEAVDYALRDYPVYSNVDMLETYESLKGEDRPFPWELEPRLSAWARKEGLFHHGRLMENRRNHSSVNALIRAEMAKGGI